MAERLEYQVPPAPMPGAHDELNDLIETLHRSGTLRVLNDFFGRLGAVNEVALSELNTPPGRNLLGNALLLGECLTRLPPEDLQRVADGTGEGVRRARGVLADEPPSTWELVRLLHAPDTRRTLAALLALANAFGAALSRKPD